MRRSAWLILLLVVIVGSVPAAEHYIDDVLSGRQVTGRLVRLAVERHVRDLKRQDTDAFPYIFDEHQAERVIQFKQQLRHIQGEWANPRLHDTRYRMEPWQQFKDYTLFGWRTRDGYRRFTKALISVARKNGKTFDAAGTADYHYLADRPREYGPQVYFVGPKKAQGHIAWDAARLVLEKHPVLRNKVRVYKQNSVVILENDGAAQMTVWGRDSEMADGFNPSFALVDEAHLYPGHEAMEVIESGMGARRQPLTYIITTAGLDISSPVYQEEWQLATQMLEGALDPVPEHFFALLYTLDEDDDWTDESVWIKANPNLGVSVGWDYLRDRIQTAVQMPSRANAIITKNLNRWTQAETRWISDDQWMRCGTDVDVAALAGKPCYVGLDLSATQDITALAYIFPPYSAPGRYQIFWRFFIPGDIVINKERRDKVPYTYWIQEGWVEATPGDVVDYDYIEQAITQDAETFDIQEVGYDPWKAHEIVNHLTDAGFVMVPIYQRYSGMAQPTDAFEKKILGREIAHGGNPVARWMMSCTEVKSDRQGNIMPMKPERGKSGKRIDGIVAAIMGLDRAVRNEGDGGVYNERGIIVI